MKKVTLGIAILLFAGWLLYPAAGMTTADFSKKEGVPCTKCHVKPMKGDENLNAVGKCYKEKKDLAACGGK